MSTKPRDINSAASSVNAMLDSNKIGFVLATVSKI